MQQSHGKLDACLLNLATKSTLGGMTGLLISLALFKKKLPYICYGVGFGTGLSYKQCDFSLKQLTAKAETSEEK